MNSVSNAFIRFCVLPLFIAIILYVLAHVHLLVIDRLINIPVHRQLRTRISLWAFFVTFFLVLSIVVVHEVLR